MTTEQKIIKNKLGLIRLSKTLGNVSQACKVMGYSRDSFYRFQQLYEQGGELVVQDARYSPACGKPREICRGNNLPEIGVTDSEPSTNMRMLIKEYSHAGKEVAQKMELFIQQDVKLLKPGVLIPCSK